MKYPDKTLRNAIERIQTVAVLGAKQEGPAFYVPEYLQKAGLEIHPISPRGGEILGREVSASLADLEGAVDAVLIFRRSDAVAGHVPEILAMDPLPHVVWMQVGVENEKAAEELTGAGIQVIQNRCLMVEHRRLFGS